jgi:phage host-nuclease inhibitor protein Gam
VTNPLTKVIEKLNRLGRTRAELELTKQAEIQKFKDAKAALEASHGAKLAKIEADIEKTDPQIDQTITERRSELIQKDKQSFTTSEWKFQFRKAPGKTKVTDADGAMEIARKLGIVRKVADPPTRWKFNQKKFLEWLDRNPEQRARFESVLEDTEDGETLHMSPNSGHTVFHDSKRVSPPSITITRSQPRTD